MKKKYKITDKEAFRIYLEQSNLAGTTIDLNLKRLDLFEKWADGQQIKEIAFISRNDAYEYVKHMNENKYTIDTKNGVLGNLRKYYDFLKMEGIITSNPFRNLPIRGRVKKVIQNNFSEKELLELYHNYCSYLDSKERLNHKPKTDEVYQRHKLIVSLVIFQGLHTGELDKLQISDIDLKNGKIYVPSTRRSNSRVLDFHQLQTLPFYHYLQQLPEGQEKLFDVSCQDLFTRILSELRGINPILESLQHIRGSVLINWIRVYGKRMAQYMIGHRFASSTETYEIQDTTELSELLEKTHLFG